MRAKLPVSEGFVERGGVKLHYEVYGQGPETIVFVPPWSIVHSRVYKAQLPYFSERFRCVAYDARGNGKSDRPMQASAYALDNFLADALAVTRWDLPRGDAHLARVRLRAGLPDISSRADLLPLAGPDGLACDALEVARLAGTGELALPPWRRLRSLTVVEGTIALGGARLSRGETAALPATFDGPVTLDGAHAILAAAR